jgi:hypothetical protein
MATLNYLAGRKKYSRPQALLFSNNPGTLLSGANGPTHVPSGYEIGTDPTQIGNLADGIFLILSDHNRSAIDVKYNRLEQRERTINGKMRSFFIADKSVFTISWQNLPSRSFENTINFNTSTGKEESGLKRYTVDGGAGGNELLNWYLESPGSFYLFLAYDKYNAFQGQDNVMGRLNEYQEVKEVVISDFSYNVNKRGSNTHDLWDVTISLEEV